jgi:alpha-D-glucose phosphate-specific phosphoglucomutase
MPIHFGTDGWRAVISDEFTFANLRLVARAIAQYFLASAKEQGSRVVVGYDSRFLSDRYALEVSRILADQGLAVHVSRGDCPTPAMAYAITDLKAIGGVMITASHNPPRYNGVKVKGSHGGPAMPEETNRIEELLAGQTALDDRPAAEDWALSSLEHGYPGVTRFDPMPAYLAHIRNLVNLDAIRSAGLRVVVDPMYGSGRRYSAALLREAGCQVTELHAEMNPGFGGIHPEPIERNLGELVSTVRSGTFDLGLATDGDADRIGAVDAQGEFVDPHRIFSLILRHLVEKRGLRGAVVKSVSTTQLLNKISQKYGLELHETPVGFNYICDWMLKTDVLMAGEESGGLTIRGHVPDGDGILMGLLLTEVIATRHQSVREAIAALLREYGEFHYGRKDVHTRSFNKRELRQRLLDDAPSTLLAQRVLHVNGNDGVKYLLDDDSWLLIRPSGTEPLLRIYAEGRTQQQVQQLLAAGAGLARV